MPAVSVIMPLYNSSDFMEVGIRSVLSQSFADLELILVDDHSSDDSLERAHNFAGDDCRVKVLSQGKNGGAAVTRNIGIDAARGRFIAFLDSDDNWHKEKLDIQIGYMKEKESVFSYTDYAVVSYSDRIKRIVQTPHRMSYADLLKNTTIGCSTVIYDSERLGKRHFPTIRMRQDLGLWLSILRDIDFAYRCGAILTNYRERPGSISRNKLKAAQYTWRVYREVEKLSVIKSSYYFSRYAVASVLRRI